MANGRLTCRAVRPARCFRAKHGRPDGARTLALYLKDAPERFIALHSMPPGPIPRPPSRTDQGSRQGPGRQDLYAPSPTTDYSTTSPYPASRRQRLATCALSGDEHARSTQNLPSMASRAVAGLPRDRGAADIRSRQGLARTWSAPRAIPSPTTFRRTRLPLRVPAHQERDPDWTDGEM